MIRVILQGGLGNQMFEYAAGLAMAIKTHSRLVLDTSVFDVYGNRAWCRPYELGVFRLNDGVIIESERHFAVRLLPRMSSYCRKHGKPRLDRLIFDATTLGGLTACRKYELFGYFANCHFCEAYREELLRAFSFRMLPNEANQRYLNDISTHESVSVHIRRGDYLNSANAGIFWHPTVEWYRQAMAKIDAQVTNATYYFFSDDIAWVREQFGDMKNAVFVDINHGREAYNDMRLMASCKHNIIANSTFSWWGAWLNTNPQKIVFAPARYYTDEHANNRYRADMILPGWITM